MTTLYDPMWFLKLAMPSDMKQWINPAWFSPAYTFNFAGDADIENRVVSGVASYGRQIGWLNEIVLALAKGDKPDNSTINKLAMSMAEIEEIKFIQQSEVLRVAVDALDQLKQTQPDLYEELIKKRSS